MFAPFEYAQPKTVSDAVEALKSEGAVVHGGGSDLITCLREHIINATKLVSLSGLASELSGVTAANGGLRIGALTTLTHIVDNPDVNARCPGLAQAAHEVGSPQLRNQGTIAGNICQKPRCWYYRGEFNCIRKGGPICYAVGGENQFHCILGGANCYIVHPSDTSPALLALDAKLTIMGPGGTRTDKIEDIFILPEDDPMRETSIERDEFITAVDVPAQPKGPRFHNTYRKVRARRSWDFALSGLALALAMDGKRVIAGRAVLSGAAPVPWRSHELEQAIMGKELTPDVIDKAAEAAMADAEPMSKNAYKIPLFKGMVREELAKAAA
ncbi:FAD binding domain-containing protein [Oceanidesulfovibrio marinus]|uniref:Xanthine dehydrogenase family protein subunit M n=1 Tax=Oceanidesulfovibrio marinus TaxID=370038 RepID=A0A6P1ZIL5_9BACT|nr:xanthine dehydrogenase family protein subunit M [Oceanidesulfovibrio marinus]QJT09376.1 xanthine dehydrogenase family protein subunit M [Oceanidesulfovibrio marinus]TVM32869.1 xanthine dehydrogenase family protein subunit M [Oceanidesulfovibrio marinus]